ncbi:MAG: hypothetical protein ISR59_09165 [Anaerolineales bacterium]|uniref:CopZ zinc binding domain-containing protein n=1 Tax=Candidatus Desulfolinea nitratireducens TaxID=2841698 RepID=A0A8J6NLL8_9CHLR|nr:hypothetical protein [Candidatus Desulfolinea nitratireducens]MBL6961269.1 hypothetical protein [Anaerolineales bacterium]
MDSCGCSISEDTINGGGKSKGQGLSGACPTNGVIGKKVDTQTVKAILALPLNLLTSDAYRFCADPDCSTVYYSEDGQQLFDEADLRERVYQKHADDKEISICYCFRHTVGNIGSEIAESGKSTVVAEITAGIKAGQCACDIRNPQGDCCLGNVRALVKDLSN